MAKRANTTKHLVEAKEIEPMTGSLNEVILDGRYKYLMVNVLASRAREINRGEPMLVMPQGPATHTEIVLDEIRQDKLKLNRKQKSKVLVSLIKND